MSGISDKNLAAEVELLKRALAEKQEENIVIFDRKIELEESLIAWQEKFQRLYESHKKIQNVNQNLEEKLLKLVDKNASERAKMTRSSTNTSIRLNQANFSIMHLQREIERYKRDIALAIHLLRCNPKGFLSPSVKSLPSDLQSKITKYANSESDEKNDTNTVFKGRYQSIPTNEFMSSNDFESPDKDDMNVSPIAVSKFLEDEINEVKHCETCCCSSLVKTHPKLNKYEYLQYDRSLSSPTSYNSLPFHSNSQSIDAKSKQALFNNQNFVHHKMCDRAATKNQNNDTLGQQAKKNNSTTLKAKQPIENGAEEIRKDLKPVSKKNVQIKSFENHLLEYIKNKNLKKNGPRICALRIHDDGIYIDNTQDEIFIRKKSLIDFDAFDKYESISPLFISSICSTVDDHVDDEIFSVNKTDSEKFNEIKSQSNVHGYSTSDANFDQDQSPNENAVMKHQRITEWINSSINAPPQTDSASTQESTSDFNERKISESLSSEYDKDKMDLLQMEYNVKQFLLKQNEWSVYRDLNYNEACSLKLPPTRTETNL